MQSQWGIQWPYGSGAFAPSSNLNAQCNTPRPSLAAPMAKWSAARVKVPGAHGPAKWMWWRELPCGALQPGSLQTQGAAQTGLFAACLLSASLGLGLVQHYTSVDVSAWRYNTTEPAVPIKFLTCTDLCIHCFSLLHVVSSFLLGTEVGSCICSWYSYM